MVAVAKSERICGLAVNAVVVDVWRTQLPLLSKFANLPEAQTEEIVAANVGVECGVELAPWRPQAALFLWAALSSWVPWGAGQPSKAAWMLRLLGSRS